MTPPPENDAVSLDSAGTPPENRIIRFTATEIAGIFTPHRDPQMLKQLPMQFQYCLGAQLLSLYLSFFPFSWFFLAKQTDIVHNAS